ncbi:MAG: hypothetical protein IKU34_09275 [Clostridia bacterium]|nr:hypothetical protein [Clostridia bacterium]
MKKLFALLIALSLCFACAAASAAGLTGLGGGGLSGLGGGASAEPMPDPSKVLDTYGQLLQADYAFAEGYICDAYVYERPSDVTGFIDSYTTVCRKAGYTVTATTVDGAAGYSVQNNSDLRALLVPNFDGQLLLLVQKGMEFDYQERTNYATCIYNNRDYNLTVSSTGEWASVNAYSIMFKAERAPFKYISLYFPQHARSGDVYSVSGQKYIEGFEVSLDNKRWLVSSVEGLTSNYRYDDINPKSKDYATLELYTVKNTEDGLLVEGCFNCRCNNGDTVFEDFVFSAILEM